MAVALVLAVIAACIGWRRAARGGGSVADRWQYAAAHGIPAFLLGMIGMVVLAEMRLLGW